MFVIEKLVVEGRVGEIWRTDSRGLKVLPWAGAWGASPILEHPARHCGIAGSEERVEGRIWRRRIEMYRGEEGI